MKISTKGIASVVILTFGVGHAFTISQTNMQTIQSGAGRLRPQKSVLVRRSGKLNNVGLLMPETQLLAGITTENEKYTGNGSILPSAIFILSSVTMALLSFAIHGSSLPGTTGVRALFWTSVALFWDNFVIGIGKPFFSDVDTNEFKRNLLKTISYPRFTAHAVFLPFLYTTGAEIGNAMGVAWLQKRFIQTLMTVVAAAIGIISRVRFMNSEGIEIKDTSNSPPTAWERNLVWFTYVKPEILYIVPAAILSLLYLVIGIAGFLEGSHRAAAICISMAGGAALYGNTKPSHVMRFTGNIGEAAMLWATYGAATLVL